MKKFTSQASNLGLLTATGVFVMGSGRIGRYLAGFCGVFVLACVSYWIANQANVKYWGLSYALGAPGLMVAWIVTPLVVVFMYIFGTRVLKMANRKLAIIIACATSVCGGLVPRKKGGPHAGRGDDPDLYRIDDVLYAARDQVARNERRSGRRVFRLGVHVARSRG